MKRDYFSRLRLAARWQLERGEVDDVLSDYQDLMHSRSEEELLRDFGSPVQAIKVVSQPKVYYQWIAAFLIMAALLPLSCSLQLTGMVPALLLAFLWFQLRGTRENGGSLPRGLLPVLISQAVLLLFVWVLIWFSLSMNSNTLTLFERFLQRRNMGPLFYHSLRVVQGCALLSGLCGLVAARLGDRRWRVIYITAILLIALAGALISLLSSMSIFFQQAWYIPFLLKFILITVIGLVGTGVGFC